MNITWMFINTASAVLTSVIMFLPDTDPDVVAYINGSMDNLVTYIQGASFFFPVTQFGIILGLILTLETGMFAFKIIRWILSIVTIGIIK